jgi:hypothetical protein
MREAVVFGLLGGVYVVVGVIVDLIASALFINLSDRVVFNSLRCVESISLCFNSNSLPERKSCACGRRRGEGE